jgi:nucleoside-diphosphate-sugar epimerase
MNRPSGTPRRDIDGTGTLHSVFLTGGTGFLGSYLAAALLSKGSQVTFLARPGKRLSAEDRVRQILDWHEVSPALRRSVCLVTGDVTQPGLGIGASARRSLVDAFDGIIHCASNTSFAEKDGEVTAANVDGMRHILDFAAESRCRAFHHLSTAYVAGRRSGLCPEELATARTFHNVYEQSKCAAEWLAWERCQAEGIRLTIYRPSIVYGHSQTGRTLQFSTLYYPIKTAYRLRKLYETDIRERGDAKAKEMGVWLDPDGTLYLPIRIEVGEGCGLNLIPADYFVAATLAIMEEAPEGGIYHLVNEEQVRLEDLIDYTKTYFRLRGVEACPSATYHRVPLNALETLIENQFAVYAPYMRDTRVFAQDKAAPLLARRGLTCPPLDWDVFCRCVDYAVQVGWVASLG